jgi:hypothetical protein
MRKSLLALSLTLLVGGAAVAIAATNQPEAPAANAPVLLAQASPQPFTRPLPPPEGRGRGAPLNTEQAAARRQARCEDRADRLAGQLAYLEARLDLTGAQQSAFARWRDVRMAAAQRQARTCAERPVAQARGAAANPVERMARQEDMLRQRLSNITAERPALEALYNSLTPEQREKFRPAAGMGRGGMRPRAAMAMRDRLTRRGPMMR